jgi:hypothetical protein
MARSTPNQYPVVLTDEQRRSFSEICSNGHAPARKIKHARILLLSDHEREGGPLTRTQIGELFGMHPNSVDKVRKRFVLQGEAPALNRKPRETPPVPPILDGHSEAHLVAICCSDPPEGRVCWTMQLLADELIKRRIVTQISAETVLYEAFTAAEAHALKQRLEIHYAPRSGSWLNVAEIDSAF